MNLLKLGNTVESCIIETWHKQVGDLVAAGDVLCDVETDKATLEVESPDAGMLLALFVQEGDEVPVLTTIAAIGEPGEEVSHLRPVEDVYLSSSMPHLQQPQETRQSSFVRSSASSERSQSGISPRAKKLAKREGLNWSGISGTGPNGRIIERDIQAVLTTRPQVTPVVQRMVVSGEYDVPSQGSGPKGRIMRRDLQQPTKTQRSIIQEEHAVEIVPVKGIRKVIAERMRNAIQTTVPFTLHISADARALKKYRQRLKTSDPGLGLSNVTIHDLILFTVVLTLRQHRGLNAHFLEDEIHQFSQVDLGFAVDTPQGLLVPVIREAQTYSLKALANEAKRLADVSLSGKARPDELTGGTFTVSNLGSLGIETFTPVLNPPQVAILGVGNINLKPIEVESHEDNAQIEFVPHLNLSLTVDHQAIDGAPAARFMRTFVHNLSNIDLLTAGVLSSQ